VAARGTAVKIARLDDIAPGTAPAVAIPGATMALFNLPVGLSALDDSCVRCGRSLAAGTIDANLVSCSGCDWRYDVTSGCVNGVPALRTQTFEVVVVDGYVVLVGAA
jgi:nitrite reductase/ring-hydroxylating ferredoxin subunit